jgi:hypothetical protein
VQDSIPGKVKKFFSSPQHQIWLWSPPSLLFDALLGAVCQEKWLGYKADHSFPFSAEAENEQSCISSLPICLDHVYRDNFTCLFVSLRYIG